MSISAKRRGREIDYTFRDESPIAGNTAYRCTLCVTEKGLLDLNSISLLDTTIYGSLWKFMEVVLKGVIVA